MKVLRKYTLGALVFFNIALQSGQKVLLKATSLDANNLDISMTIPLDTDEYVYADLIQLSVNNPDVKISAWQSSVAAVVQYDAMFKQDRKIIKQSPTLNFKVTKDEKAQGSMDLRLVYYTNKSKTAHEQLWPLSFGSKATESTEQSEASCPVAEALERQAEAKTLAHVPVEPGKSSSWFEYLKGLALASKLLWVRLLIAFLLGILLSLTPCIYPMIPITIGILNAHGAHSFLRSFGLALAYTMGVATTFASLGLAAALAGHAFGSFMHHPLVILIIVMLLIYSAFSLFGFYEIRMPRFLQKSHAQGGSLLAAYLFGVASGTIASPCLSPGLLFMLTLVATMKSIVSGFLLLFCFAIGLSMPLLIVGTFSSSLKFLPRAGAWMIEIKNLFGFMLLGMCFYFLAGLLSLPLLLGLLAIFMLITGIFYVYHAQSISGSWKPMCNILGMLLIASSVYAAAKGVKEWYLPTEEQKICYDWLFDFRQALNISTQNKKPIFVFIHAPRCLSCVELGNKLSSDVRFKSALCNVVPVDCDLSKRNDSSTQMISSRYEIFGAPSCLLLDCVTHKVIKRWDGELDAEQYEDLIKTLQLIH